MYKVWFEREPMSGYKAFLEGLAEATRPDPNSRDPYDRIHEADAVLAGSLAYTAEVMDKAPKLKVIARSGIGVDSVDIGAATARGIMVANAPDAPTIPTAEQTMMLILAVAKNLKQCEARLRAGEDDIYKTSHQLSVTGQNLRLTRFRAHRAASGTGRTSTRYDCH